MKLNVNSLPAEYKHATMLELTNEGGAIIPLAPVETYVRNSPSGES